MSEYSIQVEDQSGKRSTAPIDRFPFSIGRGAENDLVIPEPSVSRQHAMIRWMPEGLSVVDNESRNGVFVNNLKVLKQHPLVPGDTLRIGSARLKLNHSRNPVIPRVSRGTETIQYFPSRETWDPLAEKRPGALGQLLPRFLLETPTSAIYEQVLGMVEEVVPFDRACIILFGKEGPRQSRVVAKRMRQDPRGEAAAADSSRSEVPRSEVIVSTGILHRVAQGREAVIVTEADVSARPTESFVKSGAASALCVPLLVGGRVTGVIYLDRTSSGSDLAREHVEALGPLAGLAALKIENLRLLDEQVASQLLVRDLDRAKAIQESLLPREPPALPGYSVDGSSVPCYQVGGDYYDFFREEGDALAVAIGDVSGKGLSSAMYMACVRSMLHAHLEQPLELGTLMSRLERQIQETFRSDHFLTLLIGRLSAKDGLFTYCNAGHLPPIALAAGGEPVELPVVNRALNIAPGGGFECGTARLEPGGLLFLYTDGLLEAGNAAGEQFGSERLCAALARHREKDLAAIRRELFAEVEAYSGEEGPADDRTLVLIRRRRGG